MRGKKAKALRRHVKQFNPDLPLETKYVQRTVNSYSLKSNPIRMESCIRKEYQVQKNIFKSTNTLFVVK